LVARGARAIQADLSHAAGIEAFIAAIQREASSLRAIIHNASLWLDDAHVAAHPEAFEAMMQLHVHAPYRINLACEALLQASSRGDSDALTDIIHISDSRVARGSAQRAAYMASKAALDNLTLSFAARFAPHTKVNTIAPGLILFNQDDDAAYRQRRLSESALGFEPGAHVVWQTIQFILDNRYLTGTSIALDGGINIK
jgi:dihydromonapterin reductase/dihydrofolate reductase